jgi:hypothetical protein
MEHRIEAYKFGHITVDGKEYQNDVIITPKGVRAEWWRKEGHEVSMFDIAQVLDPKPALLIVGTGASGMCRVLPEVEAYCRAEGIELIAVPTPEAVVEYNTLEDKDTAVCALHLTC